MDNNISCIILAAGDGTRMKSDIPKVLHKICAKPMISILVDTLFGIDLKDITVVTGFKEYLVKSELSERVSYVTQKELLGTGHAVLQTRDIFKDKQGKVIVLCGDVPLIRNETLLSLIEMSNDSAIDAVLLTTVLEDPFSYGRVVKDTAGRVIRIVEEKDAQEEEKDIKEINTGIYCLDIQDLFEALEDVSNENKQGEYYLTDIIEILSKKGKAIKTLILKDYFEAIGINSRKDISNAEKYYQKRISERLIDKGVTIIDPDLVYIEEDVEIGKDTVIEPFVRIGRGAKIGDNCVIGSFVYINENEMLGQGESVLRMHEITHSSVHKET